MKRELLFSVNKSDCRWDYYRGSGKGGQKRNKTSNCVRCTHEPSGAVGKSEEGRSQKQNRKKAFRRMAESEEFKRWVQIEASKKCGETAEINKAIDKEMRDVKCELRIDGKWVEEK